MDKENKKKLILIDGNAIIHRAYHALPPLTNKKGEMVNAVYGFASTLLSVIEKFKPDYIAASFDLAAPTFRHKKFADYKATRAKAPDELYAQIPKVKEVVRAFNIPIYEMEGFEADDVIGTIAKRESRSKNKELNKNDIETIIVTGDLDALQLVDENIKVYTMRRGLSDSVLYDEAAVKERYGISPEQLKDFKGLRGDASDNIPGVKGIGEKGAVKLIQEYGSLENIYQNVEKIKGAVGEKLKKDKAQAILSKYLGIIKIDVALDFDLEKCKTADFERGKIVKIFQELNFFSLIKRIPDNANMQIDANNENMQDGVKEFKYEKVEDVGKFAEELGKQKEFALSLKIGGGGDISAVSFSWKTGRAYSLSWNSENKKALKNILENKDIFKIGYNLKDDCKSFKKEEIDLGGIVWDIMLAKYVLEPGGKIEFEKMVLEELGEEIRKEEKKQLTLGIESEEDVVFENCRRVDYIFKLKNILERKMKEVCVTQDGKYNLQYVFEKVEMPLVEILARMELSGVKVDTLILKGISEKIGDRISNLEKSIYQLSGKEFNINSPSQLSEILFKHLKLPTADIKKTKTKYSTAASELEKLKDEHKIIAKIEEYREIFKLKTTYLDTLPKMVDGNSRIHTTYNQAVAATGRLSSENPNLQNIPIRTDLGKLMRVAFSAEDGYVFVSADYSQIDLRVMAHMSGDKKMIEAFWARQDIHQATAAEINKVSLSQVTEKMRRNSKALNFGIIYGMGTFGFSQSAGISREEARKFISAYMEKFSDVAKFIKQIKEQAKKDGFVQTEIGRRRYLPEINSPNFQVQSGAERMAINMPIQGLAADIMKLAMIAVYSEYENNLNVKMILQIHDEIILEVRKDLADEVSKKVKNIMENVYKLKVPLVVDVKIGDNWGEL
ncbi:MAG: polymerase protein [Candidatus Moranbacteria bacterium GW2011_GWE2_35_2-]|nr:MAG: polymerase protein [Candidatus Moranbacteria bacterium GW2011_GWE2_35_2-]KKQ22272.1 MAG: polymerase protein [Candidatus Moranbacteria bacterium GW2011_GWF2_37_11]KKQ28500.1 MAG: polymerase protein [Candidatus Moranbacteria bacterium GW2011_GWD1_37_17]KKQ30236.1 MAG: polymerase protein [Candidatus Moranbacteria bacterium GW2011_GWE1_37_24]HBO16408.1 DNA polymerase I [Candidatus Moranbacteria bacterium]